MYKNKTSYYYLERGFPENLQPAFTNCSTKRKRFLVERKKRILKRAIRKSLRTLVKPLFSAPTKKGLLLEKSRNLFQNLFLQEEGNNLQRKPASTTETLFPSRVFSLEKTTNFSKNAPSFLQSKKESDRDSLHPNDYKGNLQDFPNKYRGGDPVKTTTKTRFNPLKRGRTVLRNQEGLHSRSKYRRYKFIFPLHRLKGELLKRESQYGKIELYKKQIQEKRKLALLYGRMSKNSIKKLIKQARNLSSTGSSPIKGLVTLLESRLDVALFRASFFSSVPMARQWISHGKVTINKKKVRAPSYQLRGGDCIEILSTCALPLKEKIKRRVTAILPFRRSRKKLVTPSLIETLCSFERVFPKEKEGFRVDIRSSYCKQHQLNESFLQSRKDKHGALFSKEKTRDDSLRVSRSHTKPVKILTTSALIESFSLMKDHLQSIWEKSVQSQASPWVENENSLNKTKNMPSFLHGKKESVFSKEKTTITNGKTPFIFYRSGPPSTKRGKKRDSGKVSDKKWGKTRTSFAKMVPALQRGVTLFGRLKKKEVETLDFLNAKQALIQPRNRMQRLAGLQVSGIKPLHLEISYRLLAAIFLYSPQKVAYPCNLDLPLIIKSFK